MQAVELARQFRLLAIKITEINSLSELKFVYRVITLFVDSIAAFKHKERKYCLEHEIRKGILNPMNTCIATENNFKRRINVDEKAVA